ncbi:hypothetical protein QBC39DRAFT_373601 [Podospora conica]|nr:hypothetical protein QBC39DRAFT_373601 [Schizothecium conicum]
MIPPARHPPSADDIVLDDHPTFIINDAATATAADDIVHQIEHLFNIITTTSAPSVVVQHSSPSTPSSDHFHDAPSTASAVLHAPAHNDPWYVPNSGTILTRLTTLDRGGGTTVVQVPETIPAQTSQVVVETLTSTRPNGEVVMVTQTSYVPADPAVTGEGYNANEPSLHNGAPGKKGLGGVAVGVMVGVMIGAALV